MNSKKSTMSDQELKFFQEPHDEDNICASMLHLSTAAAAAAAAATKRVQSPLSPTSFQQLNSKRATPSPSPSSADLHLSGFTKLQLPRPFPASAPLRRTVSEPIYSDGNINSSALPPPNQPPDKFNENAARESAKLRNSASIYRTLSDPNSVARPPTGGTPPRPPATRNAWRSPNGGESPSTKRLKRMKDRLREMSQWWNQVVSEEEYEDEDEEQEQEQEQEEQEQEENHCGNYCNDNIPKEEPEGEMGKNTAAQEAVWVENNGECLVLHFKCPCGNGYQILLSGRNCYYKLTNF